MTRGRSVKIGAFVTGAVLLFLVALLVFANMRLWTDRTRYWTVFPYSVTGLDVGAQVELWGVRVGTVNSIQLGPGGVRVGLEIDSKVGIPSDARASLKIEGLTGIKYIDIHGGELGGPSLPPGERIAASPYDLGQALESSLSVVQRLDTIVASIESVVSKSASLLDNLNALLGPENRLLLAGALLRVAEAAQDAQTAADELAALMRQANQRVPTILQSLGRAGRNAEAISERGVSIANDLDSTARDVKRAAGAMTTLTQRAQEDLPDVLFQIRAAAIRAQTVLRSLEANPSRLLRGRPRKELPPP